MWADSSIFMGFYKWFDGILGVSSGFQWFLSVVWSWKLVFHPHGPAWASSAGSEAWSFRPDVFLAAEVRRTPETPKKHTAVGRPDAEGLSVDQLKAP